MSDAWIGVIGAAIGALAGIGGGWLTYVLTSRRARRVEIRSAAADLIAKAAIPTVLARALESGAIKPEQVSEVLLPWSEDTMRARARLAGVAPDLFAEADYLWQRSSDQMDAVLRGDLDAAGALTTEVSGLSVELESALARETSGRRIQRALD